MGGPFGFGAPNEMDIGFEDREEVDGGFAAGIMSSRGDACQYFLEMSTVIAHFNAKP